MYEALFEDEDDIFGGSPRSKFMDVMFNANRNIAQEELAALVERMAAMEVLLSKQMDEEALERAVKQVQFEEADAVGDTAKSIYIETMGHILSQSE